MQDSGKLILGVGLLIIIVGIIVNYFGDKLTWIGHLPGDISVEKENFRFYFPITTMVLVSIIFNLLYRLFKIFF